MESVDLEKFSVDSDLQSIADAMTVAGLNFCGGVFDHLETGEEFELTISKCSGVRDLKSNHDRLVEENAELRKSLELMVDFAEGQMHPEQNDPSMFDDEDFGNLKHAKQLLNK